MLSRDIVVLIATLLAGLAFGQGIELDAIPVTGIDKLELCDLAYGQELGYVIKLLAIAQRRPDGLSLRVRPAFISKEHPLAWVSGPFNAVSVYGHATGHTMYYGRGAGGMPTASAVVADLTSVAIGTAVVVYFHIHGFSYPGMEELAAYYNLPAVIKMTLSPLSLTLGPAVILFVTCAAALYPAFRIRLLKPVDAMRAV